MTAAIALRDVTKKYGSARGVTNVNLTVKPGEVFGFLGPNGAGKTTTIRMMLNFTRPTSGSIQILGMDSRRKAVAIHKRVGYLTGDMEMDRQLTGQQYLQYIAHLRGGIDWNIIQGLITRLNCETTRKITYLSRGNKQKIGLVAALMHDPDLLILDEPTSGLDPLVQLEFQKIVAERRQRGKTVFISSHVLGEIQQVCDHVGFIREGRLVDVQPLRTLQRKSFKNIRVVLTKPVPSALHNLKDIHDLNVNGTLITCKATDNYPGLLHALSALPVQDITIEEASLDDLFMHYYQTAPTDQEPHNV